MHRNALNLMLLVGLFGAARVDNRGEIDVAGASQIQGTRIAHFITDTGRIDIPVDLTRSLIGAWVGNPEIGFTYYPGNGAHDGTFTIPDVPQAPYYLRFNSAYFVTSARNVDLSYYNQGRPDAIFAGPGTSLVLDIQGLNPWGSRDEVDLVSSSVGTVSYNVSASNPDGGYPHLGDTSILTTVPYSFPWMQPPLLIDPSRGDQTTIYQMVTKQTGTNGNISYSAAGKALTSPKLAITDRETNTFSGSLSDVPQDQTFSLRWNFSSSRRYGSDIHPSARFNFDWLRIDALPGGTSQGQYTSEIPLVNTFVIPAQPDQTVAFVYGNPFPDWGRFVLGSTYYTVPYALPLDGGTSTPVNAIAFIDTLDDVSRFPTDPFEVQLSPARNLTINGQSATSNLSEITTTPRVSWDRPAQGQPTHYVLRVNELYLDGIQTRQRLLSRLSTVDTSIVVPPGLLELGKRYYFQLTAIYQPGTDIQQSPFLLSFPQSDADAFTGILQP